MLYSQDSTDSKTYTINSHVTTIQRFYAAAYVFWK